MFDWWRRLNRAELLKEPFPETYRELLRTRLPLARTLDQAEREKLEALVRIFVSEKTFEGAGGLTIDDEMRVVIAARACLLVLHRVELDSPLYPDLGSIVVYPSTYRVRQQKREGYVVVDGDESRLGESWTRGVVVLAWDAVLASDAHPGAGHDVVLHEFAHQLDAQDGAMDGTPELDTPARYAAWTQIATAEFAALHAALAQHVPPTLDPYGATNPAEFFATSVEAFFETPERLAHQHAKLYAELAAFFHFDPVARLTAHDTAR